MSTQWADTARKKAPDGKGDDWYDQVMAAPDTERKAKFKELMMGGEEEKAKEESEKVPPIADFTAAAENIKLREWGKRRGQRGSSSAGGGASGGDRPAWKSSLHNPKVQKGSPTKVEAPHPERALRNSPKKSLAEEQDAFMASIRPKQGLPPSPNKSAGKDDIQSADASEYDAALKEIQADHERELHELQRCLKVQADEIGNLKVNSLELQAAKDIAKSMADDLKKSHSQYTLMEKKWIDASETLRQEQRRNAMLTVAQGQDDTVPEYRKKDTDGDEVLQSSVHSLTHAEEAVEHKDTMSLAELKAAAADAHSLEEELNVKGKHEEAKEAGDLAFQLDESVKELEEEQGVVAAAKEAGLGDATLEDPHAKTIVELKETQVMLAETERELENAMSALHDMEIDNDSLQAQVAAAPTHAELDALKEENTSLKAENEEMRLKAESAKDMSMADAEGDDYEAKYNNLKKDKARDHEDLMMEMHTQEADWDKERQELLKEIETLNAQLEGN